MTRVLVVDDREENDYLLSSILRGSGYEVDVARNGAEALAQARRQAPGLVVSDLLMPVMDGYTLLRHWRMDAGLGQIPFVVYTATYTAPEDEQLALRLGADAFILKPAEPEEFVARIRQVLAAAAAGRLVRAAPAPAGAAGDPLFKEYSEALVRKLEQRTAQLGEANRALERDIAERERMQHELAEREALLRTIIETEPESVHTVAPDGRFLEMNRAGLAILEADTLPQLQGRAALDFVAREYRAAYRDLHERALQGETGEIEVQSIGLRGARRWLRIHAAPLRNPQGAIVAVLGIGRDVTVRKQAEAGLLLQSAALAAAANAIVITDGAGCVEWVNPAFTTSSGYALEDARGRNLRELIKSSEYAPAFFRQMWDTVLGGRVWQGEIVSRRKDGGRYTEEMTITPVRGPSGAITHFIAIKQDITPQRRLEEQVRQAQRLEAVGTLAGGIAHDLNNILAPMRMVAGLLQDKLSTPRDRELLELVDAGAKRGADIIRQLLTFSRGTTGERAPVQLGHLIKEMAKIMRETFPREIAIEESVPSGLQPVLADATQMHQILMNLCVNARDAMPEGGCLTLAGRNVRLGEGDPALLPPARPGHYVELSVADTGTGIAPENLERIFDPFFTTKPAGKGTGLGLSTTLGIVRSHGGFIRTESALGMGTTFFVYLPVGTAAAAGSAAPAAAPAGPLGPIGHGELILVVDDEPSIRETTRRILEAGNYRAVTAVNGEDAMKLYLELRGQVRLVLTDVMMPVKGGTALIRSLRELDPGLKVVATSGLDRPLQGSSLPQLGITSVLPKPFAASELLEAIHRQLTAAG